MRALLFLLLALPASAERFEVKDGGYSIEIPAGWRPAAKERSEDAAKAPGVMLIGHDEGQIKSLINVTRFLPGNVYFKNADAFLKRNLDPKGVRIPGSKMGPVKATKLLGLPAKRWRYDTFDYVNPDSINPIEVPTVEETVFAQDKDGFWVVTLATPKDVHAKSSKAFAKVLSSLKRGR